MPGAASGLVPTVDASLVGGDLPPELGVDAPPLGEVGLDVRKAPLDAQASVVWNDDATELVAFNAGTVTRWGANGALIGTVALAGWGTQNSEDTQPQNRGIVKAGGYYYTYSAGVLSAWSAAGSTGANAAPNADAKAINPCRLQPLAGKFGKVA